MQTASVFARIVLGVGGIIASTALLGGCATVPRSVTPPQTAIASPSSTSPDDGESPTAATPEATKSTSPVPEPSASIGTDGGSGVRVVFITLDVVGDVVEASGMLPEIVEEGGSCTLTLTREAETRTAIGGTAQGPQSTYCSLLTVPVGELAPGEWSATLSYSSATGSGASAASTVSVP